jgi:hypothetical protein
VASLLVNVRVDEVVATHATEAVVPICRLVAPDLTNSRTGRRAGAT